MKHMANIIEEKGTFEIGLYIEFDETGVTLISLSFEEYEPKAFLIHPYGWGNIFDPTMKQILELDGVLIICCNIVVDLHKLLHQFGIKCKQVQDNRRYCLFDNPSQKTSIQDLAANYLGIY